MGLDYGTKTVGVAVSDPLLITAQGLETIRRDSETKLRRTFARLEALIGEYEVTEIVLGMPYLMDGTAGAQAEKVLAFKEKLSQRYGLPVTLWDERLSTVEAELAMKESGKSGAKQRARLKENVDIVAAVLILQGYMAWKNSSL